MELQNTSRRDFLKTGCELIAGAVILNTLNTTDLLAHNLLEPIPSHKSIQISVASLTTDGKAIVASQTGPLGDRILIVRENAMTYRALSMKCTHKGCTVRSPKHGVLVCPCHNSAFDLDGVPTKGPAKRPLGRYETSFDATSQTVTVRF